MRFVYAGTSRNVKVTKSAVESMYKDASSVSINDR
jgi:hypothetical protein